MNKKEQETHDLQWLIVKLRMSVAYLLENSERPHTRTYAERLIHLDPSGSINYEFDSDRIRLLEKRWDGNEPKPQA